MNETPLALVAAIEGFLLHVEKETGHDILLKGR